MIEGKSVRHELGLAIDVLMFGISKTHEKPENHYERVIMRTALCLLEVTMRHINGQIERDVEAMHTEPDLIGDIPPLQDR